MHNTMRRRNFLGGSFSALLASGGARGQTLEIADKHPRVFLTPEDVARAQENVARYSWAKQIAGAIRREADAWLSKDDDWLRAAQPKAGAAFAYGLTGCPICFGRLLPWARDAASFENPGHVRCPNGHVLPEADHPDTGNGYVAPDKRIHYLVGTYNAWVVETLTFRALENLVYAYSLTGDEKYAAKAAVVLDGLASIYPTAHRGVWDYPSPQQSGRLDRPYYQASRVLIHYVDHYDQLYRSPVLDRPSIAAGMTRRRNIEDNLLRDGGAYCYEQSKKQVGLHNGEADYIRGALAVGVCLRIPEYVEWAVNGPCGIGVLLDNAVGRDGEYFETTPMYSDHTRELYFTFAEPLRNGAGLDLYRHPKLRQLFSLHNLSLNAAGHMPRYGDAPPDLRKRPVPVRPFERSDYDFLEKLWARGGDDGTAVLLDWLADGRIGQLRGLDGPGIPESRVAAGMSIYREPGNPQGGEFSDRAWLLFHGGAPPQAGVPLPPEWQRRLTKSDFLGQKGLGILRSGEGAEAQGLLLRFGPSLVHGHLDDLNINYLARGYELTYDIGYGYSSATQTQGHWAMQTVSHNLVVVDESSQVQGGETGGSLLLFEDAPMVKLIEASSESSYRKRGVSVYQRLAVLIGAGAGAYLLDIFRVRGGKQHDWVFHTLSTHAEFSGVTLGEPMPGSLAGADIALGAMQLNDGELRGDALSHAPGNGYGFLEKPQRGQAAAEWSADWTIDPTTRLRVNMAAAPGNEVITAVASGLYPDYPKARYVLARRRGDNLSSQFVAAIEPYGSSPSVRQIECLGVGGDELAVVPVAVKIEHGDGSVDYIYSAGDNEPRSAGGMSWSGRFVHTRFKGGRLAGLSMAGATDFRGGGVTVTAPAAAWSGAVSAVEVERHIVTTPARLPVDGSLNGQVIVFRGRGYSRTTAYRISRIEAGAAGTHIHLHATTVLGRGEVGEIRSDTVLTSPILHEYAHSPNGRSMNTGFFQGKRIRTASGATSRITAVRFGSPMVLTVESTNGFRPGDRFFYDDLQPDDRFEIASTFWAQETASGGYRTGGNAAGVVFRHGRA